MDLVTLTDEILMENLIFCAMDHITEIGFTMHCIGVLGPHYISVMEFPLENR